MKPTPPKLSASLLGDRAAQSLGLPPPQGDGPKAAYVILDVADVVLVEPEQSPDRRNTFLHGMPELVESLKEHAATHQGVGNHTPIKVTGFQKPYEIVMGRRRAYAASKAGVKLKAEVEQYSGPLDRFKATLSENVEREGYSSYDMILLAIQLRKDYSLKPEEVGKILNRTFQQVYTYYKVAEHPHLLEKMKADPEFTMRQAEIEIKARKAASKASGDGKAAKAKPTAPAKPALVTSWDQQTLSMSFDKETATESDWKKLNSWLDRVRQVIHKHNKDKKLKK